MLAHSYQIEHCYHSSQKFPCRVQSCQITESLPELGGKSLTKPSERGTPRDFDNLESNWNAPWRHAPKSSILRAFLGFLQQRSELPNRLELHTSPIIVP